MRHARQFRVKVWPWQTAWKTNKDTRHQHKSIYAWQVSMISYFLQIKSRSCSSQSHTYLPKPILLCLGVFERTRECTRVRGLYVFSTPLHCPHRLPCVECKAEHIKLPAKLLDYFLRSNKSNINQRKPRLRTFCGLIFQLLEKNCREFRILTIVFWKCPNVAVSDLGGESGLVCWVRGLHIGMVGRGAYKLAKSYKMATSLLHVLY